MQHTSTEDDRNCIPRWRSPLVADGWELAAARDVGNKPLVVDMFADQLELWRGEGTIAASIDIYDTGILVANKALQLEGAAIVLKNARTLPTALLEDVRRSLAPETELQIRRERLGQLEGSERYLRFTIRMLKRRIGDHSRDVLSLLELARLYVLSGQVSTAERYIRRAIGLAPNNRLVLRSATQYYKLVGSLSTVLPALRNNEAVAYDPLLQSTEIAASNLAGRGSHFALAALRSLKGLKKVGMRRSELALAVATIEREAGLPIRRVFQLVRAGIASATENAQAQAVWLGEQADRPLNVLLPGLTFSENAFEAKALARFEAEDYAGASVAAKSWLADQPFETDAITIFCTCHAVYLNTAAEAETVADQGSALHHDNWIVQNAILLVYAGSGRLVKAARALANLERLAINPTVQAFALAGAGMLAFAQHKHEKGRSCYEQAIEAAKRAKRPEFVFSAAVFWVRAEATSGTMSAEEFAFLSPQISTFVRSLPASNREYAAKLWSTIEHQSLKILEDALPELRLSHQASCLDQILNALPKHSIG